MNDYSERAMYDSFIIRTTNVAMVTDLDVQVQSTITIRDIAGIDGKRVSDLANELGYRIDMLQKIASSVNISTQVIEQMCKLYCRSLPSRPNYGHTTKE